MQAAILAGGLATRLLPLTQELPKSLVPVCGRPFIEHQLALLRSYGITDIVLLVGHFADMIEEQLGDGARLGMSIRYSDEGDRRLDTAGAIKLAEPLLDDAFMVLFGDSYLQLDYRRIARDFTAGGRTAMMAVYRNDGQFDTSDVQVEGGIVTAYQKDPPLPGAVFINYGLTLMKRSALASIAAGERISLQRFLQPVVAARQLGAWEATERFYEIGSFSGLRDLETLLTSKSEHP
jgi:NDP-sugar pyrophosphorylase family protein